MPPRRRRSSTSTRIRRTPPRTPNPAQTDENNPSQTEDINPSLVPTTTPPPQVTTTVDPPLAPASVSTIGDNTQLEEEVQQLRDAMREMKEMIQTLALERRAGRTQGETERISRGYASSDFDSILSEDESRENEIPDNAVQSNPSHAVPPCSDSQLHSPLSQVYKERVRKECSKLAEKSETFTGKSSQDLTVASLHRDITETSEDHGWDELHVGTYYLLRYRLSRSVWDNVIDSIGRSFDRSCAAGFKDRIESIWRVLERNFSNAVVRDKLKNNWRELKRNPAESCRDFISRVQTARKELQYSGALVEDSDEINIWRNGLFEPYSDWVGQYLASAAARNGAAQTIQELRTEIQIRGDEYEDRHGIAAVPSTTSPLKHDTLPQDSGGIYTAFQQQPDNRQTNYRQTTMPKHECILYKCQRCYTNDHTTQECRSQKPAKAAERCRGCGFAHKYISGWDPQKSRCPNRSIAMARCRLCSGTGHFARICMRGPRGSTPTNFTEPTPKDQQKEQDKQTPNHTVEGTGKSLFVSLPNDQVAGIRYITLILRNQQSGETRLRAMIDSGSSESFLLREKYDELRQGGFIEDLATTCTGIPVEFGNGGVTTLLGRATSRHSHLEDGTHVPVEWGVLENLKPCSAILSMKTLRERGAVWIISQEGDRLYVGHNDNFLPSSPAVYAPGIHTCHALMNSITTAPPQSLVDELSGIRNYDENSPYDEIYDNDSTVESLGISTPGENTLEKTNQPCKEKIPPDAPIQVFIGPPDETAPRGRIQVRIPWKDQSRPSRSFAQAWHRDRALQQRLESSPDKLLMFRTQVNQLIQQGFAEELPAELARYPPDEDNEDLPDRHYISLVPVFSTTRNTKCRLCLDARTCNRYTRPAWHKPQALLQAFVGWRIYVWVGLFDLSKAFWRLHIVKEDRRWTCCVADSKRLIFLALPFGFNFSPCALLEGEDLVKQEIKTLLDSGSSGTTQKPPDLPDGPDKATSIYADVTHDTIEPPRPPTLRCQFYVDDGQVRDNDSPITGATQLMWVRWAYAQYGFPSDGVKTTANFHIKKEVIIGLWEGYRRDKALQHLTETKSHPWKQFLGYLWDPETDSIAQIFPDLQDAEKEALEHDICLSRRQVISIVQRWHDPLGLFNDIGGFSKCIIRNSVQDTRDWDKPVHESTMLDLRHWVLAMLAPIHVTPRCCIINEVYIFSDASTTCWCAQVRDANLHLIYSRSGLFKAGTSHTIPRKETEAAYQATITLEKFLEAMPDDDEKTSRDQVVVAGFYTDSEILIHRLRGGSRIYKAISSAERRRIEAIEASIVHNHTKARHIPGTINPADRGSRPDNYRQHLQPLDLADLRDWLNAESAEPSSLTFTPGLRQEEDDDPDLFDPNEFPLTPLEKFDKEYPSRAECNPIATTDVLQLQKYDPWCQNINEVSGRNDAPRWSRDFSIDNDGLIRHKSPIHIDQDEATSSNPIVIPCTAATLELRIQLATEAHRAAAHPGGVRTTDVVKRNYWWKRMHKTCAKVVADCECCQRARANRTWRRAAAVVKWRGNLNPGEVVGVDIMYLPPLTIGGTRFVGIVSTTCLSTKWIRVAPITGFSGQQAAEALDNLFFNTVVPRIIILDQGSNFIAADSFRRWAAKRQIRLKYFPVASSSLAGWIERSHKSLRDHLRPMLLDKEDPSLVGENNWMNRLPRAVYAWNAAPYHKNCPNGLSPYLMVYGAQPRIPGAEIPISDIELQELGINHLVDIPSWTALLQQMTQVRQNTRDLTMKEYVAHWSNLRQAARSAINRRLRSAETISVGDFVRILRPKQIASESVIVVRASGSVIRIIDASSRVSDEYIGNLVLNKSEPPNKDALLLCKESYDRDERFAEFPAIVVTRELQQIRAQDNSDRSNNLVEELSVLPVCSPDNLSVDSTVVVVSTIDGRPATSYWRVTSRELDSDVWILSAVDENGCLLPDGGTLSVTRNNGFFNSMPMVCAYRLRLPMTRDAESKMAEIKQKLNQQ